MKLSNKEKGTIETALIIYLYNIEQYDTLNKFQKCEKKRLEKILVKYFNYKE